MTTRIDRRMALRVLGRLRPLGPQRPAAPNTAHHQEPVAIESSLLFHVTGGAAPNVKKQCGPPPPNGGSNSWGFHVNVPLSKIPYVGRYLPDINIGGNGQTTSDYKTCVDAVTGKK